MAIHWQIPFKSLRVGTNYTVNIYDSTYSGQPIILKGGAQPFTTQESDDDDMFTPIRMQTGYLRIVDDGKAIQNNQEINWNWKDLLPTSATSRRVELVKTINNTTTVVWTGFMQAQTFSGRLYSNPQEREFPICCQLTVFDGFDFDPNDANITNFAQVLYYIFDSIDIRSFDNFYFHGGAAVTEWLLKKCTWINFANIEDDGAMTARYSRQSVLRDVCLFFGWTCRMYGRDVFFTAADDSVGASFAYYNEQDLDIMAGGTSVSPGIADYMPVTLSGDIFASVELDDIIIPGIRKATVAANINKVDFIFDVPYDQIYDIYANNPVDRTTYGTNKYLFTKKAATNYAHTLNFKNMVMDFPSNNTNSYFACEHIYEYYEDELAKKHSYNFNTNLYVVGEHPNDGYLVKITTRAPYSFYNGILVISGVTWIDHLKYINGEYTHEENIGDGYLQITLKIGNKYWNLTSWQDQWFSFGVRVGRDGSTIGGTGRGQIINNQTLDSIYPTYNGFGIPITGVVGGIVELSINGYINTLGSSEGLSVEGLKMEFLRPNASLNENNRDTNTYTADCSGNFSGETEIDLILASDDDNQYGTGLIMNPDGSYCSMLTYADNTQQHPEEHTVNRMAAFGSQVRSSLRLPLRMDSVAEITPTSKCSVEGNTYHPISINKDWRDDIETITLLEI